MTDKLTQEMNHKDRPVRGADLPQHERPGVPMEHQPRPLTPAAPRDPAHMPREMPGVTHRMELDEMTPVYGTAQPLHGISGLMRRLAYSIPETRARRWLLLLMADRVDVMEHFIAKTVKVAALVPAGIAALFVAGRLIKRLA